MEIGGMTVTTDLVATWRHPRVILRQHLARHDVSAEVTNVSLAGLSVAETVLQQTSQAGADLLVVGAYSRPRASEILFGGTTRSLIGEARIPMLMSR